MKFGVCTGFENAAAVKSAGFDYVELNVQAHLVPEKDEAEFAPIYEKIKALPIPALAANCFLPGHLKPVGPSYNESKLARYVENACGRAMRVGIQKLVFGSGGARQIPDGFSRDEAEAQLVEFGKLAAHIAAACGVTIVVEPLNKAECNVLTSVGESAKYVRKVGSPSFRLLVDAYHFMKDDNDFAALADAAPLLVHAHIATQPGRLPPGIEPTDFSKFFKTLKAGGFDGTISVEAKWDKLPETAAQVYKAFREAVAV